MPPSASSVKERSSRPGRDRRLSPGTPCAAAFRQIASGCLDDIAACHIATCAGDTTALHQMRVALTRLRSVIAFFSAMVEDTAWAPLKSELKWLNGYLGATRDLDVAIENSRGAADQKIFRAAQIESHRRLRRALLSNRYRQWFSDLSEWIVHGPWSTTADRRDVRRRAAPVSAFHAQRLARWHEKLSRRSRGLQGMGKGKRHRLRLASKRLRYAIEFSEGALTGDEFSKWRTTAKHLRKGQQILGELNDTEMRRRLATDLATPKGPASVRSRRKSKPVDRKKKGRLLRRAAIVYRKIAD
jgi:CHAD domain-containing protein